MTDASKSLLTAVLSCKQLDSHPLTWQLISLQTTVHSVEENSQMYDPAVTLSVQHFTDESWML